MYEFKDGIYSDILITRTINFDIYINSMGNLDEKEYKKKNARIRCYNRIKWVNIITENVGKIDYYLKELEKKLVPCEDLLSDMYVKQQIENKRVYTVCNQESKMNKKVARELTEKIYFRLKENKEIFDLEVCFLSKCEEKFFVNSCGSEKKYTYSADGIMVAYAIKESGYQGMIRIYDALSYDYDSIIKMIYGQISKDNLFANIENYVLSGKYTCIFSPEVTGILVHECFGHMSESDILDKRWVLGEKIGKHFLNIVDDGKVEGSGFTPFDDEGIDSEKTYIVKNGFINSSLTDINNSILTELKSTGNGRAKNNYYNLLIRMTNTYMQGSD